VHVRRAGSNSFRRRLHLLTRGVAAALEQPAPASWSVAAPGGDGAFEGQVVVITGAAGVLGSALVDAFASASARVHALDVDADGLAACTAERSSSSTWAGLVSDHCVDLLSTPSILRFASTLSTIDVLVHNAGHNDKVADVTDVTMDAFRRMLEVNVVGPTTLTGALTPALVSGEGGSIVFLTSIHSSRSSRWVPYGTAKGALRKLVTDLAGAMAEKGVRVNAVAPARTADKALDPDGRLTPLHLLGSSAVPIEAVSHAVLFLADRHRSPMTTGQELVVDGGALLAPRR
jgi:NAD(P)-dependent dehydrogenase (short-subunit alcohol dehydrogenase family)